MKNEKKKTFGKMTENEKKMFELFILAIEGEKTAQKLYKSMLNVIEDEELKEIIQGFYQDEVAHEKALVKRYNSLRKAFE